MKLLNPKTKDIIEVEDTHGEMLLQQGFYQLHTADEPAVVKKKVTKKKAQKKAN